MVFAPRSLSVVSRRAFLPVATRLLPAVVQQRHYAILGHGGFKMFQHTKYRITKPFTENTQYDDIYLAEPSRSDLAKFTKETPLFLRFLKLVTDQEERPRAFFEFAKRCEAGLVVECDVYITKVELLDSLWRNGYSELELNAFEIAFPPDYKFHYPELAVLFDLAEDDCYKYCLKRRANKPEELVEVKYKHTPNAIASYGLLSCAVWFGLQNNVLGNVWMMVKTWPFFAVFYMLASYFNKSFMGKIRNDAVAEVQTALQHKHEGEEAVYGQMKKYANDSRCLDFLQSFRPMVEHQLEAYRRAMLLQQKNALDDSVTRHLVAIQQAEKNIVASLQEVMVHSVVTAFRDAFVKDASMQDASITAAAECIMGKTEATDPVGDYFRVAFRELGSADLGKTKPNEAGSVVERVAAVFQQREKAFLDQFAVRPEEAAAVKKLAMKSRVSEGRFDFEKLSKREETTLDELYSAITTRVGFGAAFHESSLNPLSTECPRAKPFVGVVNSQLAQMAARIRQARLTSFVEGFA